MRMVWIILGLVVLIGSMPIYSNSADDDWLDDDVNDVTTIDIPGLSSGSSTFQDYWDEHIAVSFGAMTSYSKSIQRTSYFLSARHTEDFLNNTIKTYLSLRYRYIKRTYKSTNAKYVYPSPFNLRESYVSYSPISWASISFGNQIVVWGQNQVFSPVDLMTLPGDYSSSGAGFYKAESRLPQLTAKLSWYPTNRTEINAYYFPRFTLSPIFADAYNNAEKDGYGTIPLPSGSDAASKAIQATWDTNLAIFELNYYDGWSQLPDYLSYENPDSNFAESQWDRTIRKIGWANKKKVYGLGISKPLGNTIIRFELFRDTWTEGVAVIKRSDSNFSVDTEKLNQYNQLIDDGKNLNHAVPVNWFSLGIDGDYDRFIINLYVIMIEIDRRKDVFELQKQLLSRKDTLYERNIFPNAHMGWYLTEDKKDILGSAVGFFNNSVGISTYYTKIWNESLRLGASFELVQLLGEPESDNEENNPVNDIEPSFRIGFSYAL